MNISKYLLNTPPRQAYLLLRKQVFNSEVIKSFDEQHPCIFALSTGRVGTETVSALLSLGANLIAWHEPRPLLYGFSKACYQDDINESDNIKYEAFKALRAELFDIALQNGKGYAETSPQSTFIAPIINRVVPNVKFIHLVRHPAEVVRSGMRRGWYKCHQADDTRIVPRLSDSHYAHWQDFSQLQKNIWLWAETNRWITDFLSILPHDRKLVLRSEDIFSRDNATLSRLYDFSSSAMPPDRKIKNILLRKLNRQKQGAFPQYKEWSGDDLYELEKIAYNVMKSFDYSLNTPN